MAKKELERRMNVSISVQLGDGYYMKLDESREHCSYHQDILNPHWHLYKGNEQIGYITTRAPFQKDIPASVSPAIIAKAMEETEKRAPALRWAFSRNSMFGV
ncbi:hypothetical protein IKX64_01790 [Candidatus Saccharibacteria bacterium]|nr:hypothetical protein [Candidatus Saccharibacteria bacterium]